MLKTENIIAKLKKMCLIKVLNLLGTNIAYLNSSFGLTLCKHCLYTQ